jgi:tetratricopeptide (TPR) repeat protein
MKNINIQRLLILMGMTIFTFNTNAQRVIRYYDYKIPDFYHDNEEIKKSVTRIADLIAENGAVLFRKKVESEKEVLHTWGSEKNILVLEDRIEFTKRDETASVSFKKIINNYAISDYYGKISIYFGDFSIQIKGKEAGQKLKNEFELLIEKNKNLYYENRKSELILFEKYAAEYRALKVKPPVSEEQRKFIVQANGFNEKKMYNEAISLYEKAIEVDQTAYPAAYSNLALLSAQVKQYDNAIYHMKKYLLLVPDAVDSRGAQDKIYEWEAEIAR